ncbi:c-type cytochrome [Zavarzinia aquatilis]|uniref:Cytochrome C556 n=1 Tax=Zavarzinia aquatilis TaxID=2211142 RepID=A0A317E7B0_9PROT|nr:cytochrome c [Zavarzinia aquatilis]PWR22889.1 cytochrome C556 [Zavarzinia aquatilis]
MALLALHGSRYLAAAVIVLGLGGVALAAGADDLVEKREAAMKQAGGALKALGGEARSGSVAPDAAVKAQALVDFAASIPGLFPAGSITDKSRALPEIWTDTAGWDGKVKAFADAAAVTLAAAKAGDAAALGAAIDATGGACGGCHKVFRGPEKD